MNILFLSKLSGNLFAGPNNSVPAQIKAQSAIDTVFWYNLNFVKREEWIEIGCYNLKDYPSGRLKDLPTPFCSPDLVVVEELYCFPFCKILKDIQKKNIPYIIIPRSEMTMQAQKKKCAKKAIGNIVFFNSLIKHSVAIQYLSNQEKADSEQQWKKNSVVIPNGTNMPQKKKSSFSANKINAVYIGRYEKYQKGLDLLIKAIEKERALLQDNNFVLHMYGVDQEGTVDYLTAEITQAGLHDLVKLHGAVFGDEKESVLYSADLFIMTSRFEGMPMGMIEALAYGLPVIATTGTNMTAPIERFNAGWTSDNTVEGISRALAEMVAAKGSFNAICRNSIDLASKYSWPEIAKRSHICYEKLVGLRQ